MMGVIYTWGHNEYGQLGSGATECSIVPVQVGNHLGKYAHIYRHIFLGVSDTSFYAVNTES